MLELKSERQSVGNTDPLIAIAFRRMVVRNLCVVVVIEDDEGSLRLAADLQTMSQDEGEDLEIITAPSEDVALEMAGGSDSVAVVPSTISVESLRKIRCGRLINELDLDANSDDPGSKVSFVASLENIRGEATGASHLASR